MNYNLTQMGDGAEVEVRCLLCPPCYFLDQSSPILPGSQQSPPPQHWCETPHLTFLDGSFLVLSSRLSVFSNSLKAFIFTRDVKLLPGERLAIIQNISQNAHSGRSKLAIKSAGFPKMYCIYWLWCFLTREMWTVLILTGCHCFSLVRTKTGDNRSN